MEEISVEKKFRLQNMTKGIPKEELFIFLAVAISLLGDSSLYVLLPIFAEDLGISAAAVGILLSANRFTRLITNYYAGHLYSYMGSKRLFIMSIVLAAITTFIYGMPVGVVVLVLSRIIWGSCWSFMRLVGFIKIAEISSDDNRGTLTGMYHSVVRIGSLVAVPLGGVLSSLVGYRNTFYILAGLTLVIGLTLVMLSLRQQGDSIYEPEVYQDMETLEDEERDEDRTPRRQFGLKSIYSLTFLNSWIGSGLLISTVGYILLVRFGDNVKVFNLYIGIPIVASFLVSIQRFFSIFLPMIFGRIADRYGSFRAVIVTCLVQVLSLVVIAISKSFLVLALGAIIAFSGITALSNILDAIAIGYADEAEEKNILGHFTTWQDIGSAFGAMAGYSLVVSVGYSKTYIATAMALILILAFAIRGYLSQNNKISISR